jgi:hypothetical protein
MGNFQNKEGINLANEVDYIAANYIINNKDEIDLTKDTECAQMVQKVSSFLKKNLNGLQSNYLLKTRIQSSSNEKCNTVVEIASFYVQIANIFAAITASVYSPMQAEQMQAEQMQAEQMQAEQMQALALDKTQPAEKPREPRNFCSERLKRLINGQNYTNPNAEMIIQPNVCKKNPANEINNLALEPGIAALHTLYYDVYDIKEGKYIAMSPQMQKMYKTDVRTFYKSFYGTERSIPENITFFSDISLNDTHTDNSGCVPNSGIYAFPYKGLLSDKLFGAYALHIKEMEERTRVNQNKLLKVLDELFIVKKIENANAKPSITLNPDLNDRKLQRLAQTTRELIIQLFTTCEKDYKDGLKIYQRIVDNKLQNFIPIKKKELREEINKLMTSYIQ